MTRYGHDMQFGIFVTPTAARPETVLELSKAADVLGLDLVSFQDHPYQPTFLDSWTLLSVVAARTTNIRVALNVANLPLRPPAILARSVASLDLLSGGRVELGLGAGAFLDGVQSLGGPRRSPGESVDALAEAIEIIRGMWAVDGGVVDHDGEHYTIRGAKPGPAPAHDVEIWLGAYKRRMLALTGAKADGWLPSMGYVEIAQLPDMNAAIDAAAENAGRRPADVRRLLNINGSFGTSVDFLQGSAREWAEQLADLTLTTGTSTYILSSSSEDDVRRFAEEVAPNVRDLIASERGAPPAQPERDVVAVTTGSPAVPDLAPLAATPTPDDGQRLSDLQPWDESTRPTATKPDPDRRYNPGQQAAGQHLIDVHDHLRGELTNLRQLIDQVASGETNPGAVRSFITRMTIRQNNWTLGTFCETYCHVVTNHHMLEDRSLFPHLQRSDPELGPVLDRLHAEHETIHDLLERVDQALVALVSAEGDGITRVNDTMNTLTDALLSHFSYEEQELVEPLARLGS